MDVVCRELEDYCEQFDCCDICPSFNEEHRKCELREQVAGWLYINV